jgi:hypothetical protein
MTSREKVVLALAGVLMLALLGLLAMQRARTGETEAQLADTQTRLALQQHESNLAVAAIEAGRGSYEIARQLASDFFNGLQADVGRAPEGARAPLTEILAQRDAMITALSRSDPQAAPQLVRLLMRYRLALGERVGPDTSGSAPGAAPDAIDTTGR